MNALNAFVSLFILATASAIGGVTVIALNSSPAALCKQLQHTTQYAECMAGWPPH